MRYFFRHFSVAYRRFHADEGPHLRAFCMHYYSPRVPNAALPYLWIDSVGSSLSLWGRILCTFSKPFGGFSRFITLKLRIYERFHLFLYHLSNSIRIFGKHFFPFIVFSSHCCWVNTKKKYILTYAITLINLFFSEY